MMGGQGALPYSPSSIDAARELHRPGAGIVLDLLLGHHRQVLEQQAFASHSGEALAIDTE